jgi:hypothetical protein
MTQQLALDDAPVLARFMDRVRINDETGCWDWKGGCVRSNGGLYGHFWLGQTHVRAHRFAFERFVGPIPRGLVMDHLCNNGICVNPAHLRATTHRVNILRGKSPAARNARKTRCARGHPFSEENTYRYGENHRGCRLCRRLSQGSIT